jgi:hypothetical protein
VPAEQTYWRRCASCKKEIGFAQPYYACNVSTCNRDRTGFVFCSIGCWDAHVPVMRHRDAWAEEKRSPSRKEWEQLLAPAPASPPPGPSRAEARESAVRAAPTPIVPSGAVARDILVVVSKLKAYVRARSGMNTSDGVVEVLSDRLRELCDAAIRRAAEAGRKTVLDRDFD